MVRSFVAHLAKKYPRPYDEVELKAALTKLQAGIKTSKTGYLLDTFSYAGVKLN